MNIWSLIMHLDTVARATLTKEKKKDGFVYAHGTEPQHSFFAHLVVVVVVATLGSVLDSIHSSDSTVSRCYLSSFHEKEDTNGRGAHDASC